MDDKDDQLLNELGFSPSDSLDETDRKVANLNMRQLDRLKLMFERISKREDIFSQNAKNGIKNNDLRAFAEAVIILTRAQMKKHN
jgi:hypothetical protein